MAPFSRPFSNTRGVLPGAPPVILDHYNHWIPSLFRRSSPFNKSLRSFDKATLDNCWRSTQQSLCRQSTVFVMHVALTHEHHIDGPHTYPQRCYDEDRNGNRPSSSEPHPRLLSSLCGSQ